MSNFNSANIAEFSGVWVFCEVENGKNCESNFELLSEGRKLADDLGTELCGVLLGKSVASLGDELVEYGADKVYLCENPLLEDYSTDGYTTVISQLVMAHKPEIFLIAASANGRDFAPRVAARLHTGLCADCTALEVDGKKYAEFLKTSYALDTEAVDDNTLKMTLPAFGGHLMATIVCPNLRPAMATVRAGVLKKVRKKSSSFAVVNADFTLSKDDIRTEIVAVEEGAQELLDLGSAEVIVAVGRGIEKDVEKGLSLAKDLLDALGGGMIAGSRAATECKWLPEGHLVGQTGKTVRPKIYVALGISGAMQHRIGMEEGDYIIAINNNPSAPIFEVADYGICGDLFSVIPLLIEALHTGKKVS